MTLNEILKIMRIAQDSKRQTFKTNKDWETFVLYEAKAFFNALQVTTDVYTEFMEK